MARSITVKGVGKYSAKPDIIQLTLELFAKDPQYGGAMTLAGNQLEALRNALLPLGIDREQLKTAEFCVETRYESRKDGEDSYKSYLVGYSVKHTLKLEFDLDTRRLGLILGAIAESGSNPTMDILFRMNDMENINAAVLESAAHNARAKAEVLAKASGVALGALQSIDYDWDEVLFSSVKFRMSDSAPVAGAPIDVEPRDISVSETVTFVWEMLDA